MKNALLVVLLAIPLVGGSSQYKSRWQDVLATAYCPCSSCTNGDGKTSRGRDASTPGVAVDPNVIPYGSPLDIPGYVHPDRKHRKYPGARILADDTGGAMRQAGKKGIVQIDVRFQSHQVAKNWGRRWISVRIWEKK